MEARGERRFVRRQFEATHRQVLAYAMRRTRIEADAEDIAAETFAIAWRRMTEVPPIPLPWLYGVARRLLANQRRGTGRLIPGFHRFYVDFNAPSDGEPRHKLVPGRYLVQMWTPHQKGRRSSDAFVVHRRPD
jgi:DNA-directed RNA polymerase specialized sigma24 family protein